MADSTPRRPRSWVDFGREAKKDGIEDFAGSRHGLGGLGGLGSGGFFEFARITVLPRVLREWHCEIDYRRKQRLDAEALLPEFLEVVGLPKWRAVPGQEALQRFLRRLLGMKDDVGEERRFSFEFMRRHGKILAGFQESCSRLRDELGVMRHGATYPRGESSRVETQ